MNRRYWTLSGAMGVAALLCGPAPALAQGYLGGNLQSFAVLGGATVTCPVASVITGGDVGVAPGAAIVGFPAPCTIVGGVTQIPPATNAARTDFPGAFNALGPSACTDLTGLDLGGLTLGPGTYCFSSSAQLTGTLSLQGAGPWIFQIGTALTTASGSSVAFPDGGNPCGVEWQIGSSATIGDGSSFAGNILAVLDITLNVGSSLSGRALTGAAGAVTLNGTTINTAVCAGAGAPPPFPGPGVILGGGGAVPVLPYGMEWVLLVILVGTGAYLLNRH